MDIIEIEGNSMAPHLSTGQLVITRDVAPSDLQRGKIYLFRHNQELLIKRLVGLPQEEVSCSEGSLRINGSELSEPYLSEPRTNIGDYTWLVPPNHIIVLGDNPENSLDSRKIGPIPVRNIKSRAVFRIWPPKLL